MKKILITTLLVLIATPIVGFGSNTLWEYYQERGEQLPPIEDRMSIALECGIENYQGTAMQNPQLLNCLQGEETLGVAIPSVVALFETSLRAPITASATSMTLVSGTTKDGTTISGTYGFVIDEGSTDEEFVLAACVDTACTLTTRGISVLDGETSVYALIQPHRRGASVKMTNYPILAILGRVLNGDEALPNELYYDDTWNMSTTTALATKAYVDDVGAGGFTASNIATSYGLYALGTSPETVGIATSTLSGLRFDNDGDLQIATSSGSGIYIDTDNTFKIATTSDFTFTGTVSLHATTTEQNGARGSLVPVGSIQMYVATTSPQGWLLCDGMPVSRTIFSDLYAIIADRYGDGDGSTTFNLPDMRQRVPLGYATSTADGIGNMLGETGGATSTNQTTAQVAAHTHPTTAGGAGGGGIAAGLDAGSAATGSAGGGKDMSIMDPYITINYIIKY